MSVKKLRILGNVFPFIVTVIVFVYEVQWILATIISISAFIIWNTLSNETLKKWQNRPVEIFKDKRWVPVLFVLLGLNTLVNTASLSIKMILNKVQAYEWISLIIGLLIGVWYLIAGMQMKKKEQEQENIDSKP